MPRTVPGSGAIISPQFNSVFGVRDVYVVEGGSGYDPTDPPKLTVQNCGTPLREAVLRPVIANGRILSVEVIDPGEGYDPLRLIIESTDDGAYGAKGKINLTPTGELDFIQVTTNGDNYFSGTTARVIGGGGTGAELVPVTGGVTGLKIEREGRNYTPEDANIIISGGGGDGATGVVGVNQFGKVTGVTITNSGEFFETSPIIQLIGGGGRGATATAYINLGSITSIDIDSPGNGYTNPPKVVFARDTNLIRKQRNRQSLNSILYNITGLIEDVTPSDTTINVQTTAPFPGSGKILLNKEIVRYTGKTATSFTGCDRGTNFRYDQKVFLDTLQDDADGVSQYIFNVTDQVKRYQSSASNRIAIVYDWDPVSHALYLTFEVDELAFIDGGNSADKTKSIQFVAGAAQSSATGVSPHTLVESIGDDIVAFTNPLSLILNRRFEDDDELDGAGDGIPDLVNTGTEFEFDTNLDGGIASSKYGIEEELGGVNLTLFQLADKVYDGGSPQQLATIIGAGALGDGDAHTSTAVLRVNNKSPNATYVVGETVVGQVSGVAATVTSFVAAEKSGEYYLSLQSILPGVAVKFTANEQILGQQTGATTNMLVVEYTNRLRNEDE